MYRVHKRSGDSEAFQSALTLLYQKGKQAKIFAVVSICLAVFLAVAGVISSHELPVFAGIASVQAKLCAGCASPSRFMGAIAYVIGSTFTAFTVLSELSKPPSAPTQDDSGNDDSTNADALKGLDAFTLFGALITAVIYPVVVFSEG